MSVERNEDIQPHPDPQIELGESADYSQFMTLIPGMVRMARYAAGNEAISYRKFHVGASAYMLKFDGTKQPVAMGGANYKPEEKAPKYCAEMDIIDQAEEDSFDQIIGMVIAGTTDPEEIRAVMGRATPTLHPCHACQDKMSQSRLINDDTLIVTVGLEEDIAQVHTFGDLRTIYEVEENPFIVSHPFDLDLANWGQRAAAFDAITRSYPDTDPARIARLVLSSEVAVED